MIKHHSLHNQGILLALFAMLTFSINDGVFKYVLQHISLETAMFAGYGCSIFFLVAYGLFKKINFTPQKKRNAFVFASLFLLEQTAFIYALAHLPIAELFVVVLATPVAVLVLSSALLKEHLEKQQVLAVILGFAGALTVVSLPFFSGEHAVASNTEHLAWAAAIANVAINSSKGVYMRKYCQSESTLALPVIAYLFIILFYGAQTSPAQLHMPLLTFILLLAGGCIGAAGCIAYVRAFQLTKAALVSATQYSQIIWAVLMGVFIFEEKLTSAGIVGSLLILSSGYFLYLKKTRGD